MPHFLIQEYLHSAVGETAVIEVDDLDAAWQECHERMDWIKWYVLGECDEEGRLAIIDWLNAQSQKKRLAHSKRRRFKHQAREAAILHRTRKAERDA